MDGLAYGWDASVNLARFRGPAPSNPDNYMFFATALSLDGWVWPKGFARPLSEMGQQP